MTARRKAAKTTARAIKEPPSQSTYWTGEPTGDVWDSEGRTSSAGQLASLRHFGFVSKSAMSNTHIVWHKAGADESSEVGTPSFSSRIGSRDPEAGSFLRSQQSSVIL
jgi:hypothetical protein